jgi:bis(5'-nucleosyl)-tetraphosphatase (symmetrical)
VATYAIGDIQGCWRSLERLLAAISWDPAHDRLWLAGDLVNRGPGSLEVLRWAASLPEERLVTVLGNHDLHLLSAAEGLRELKPSDTLQPVLEAPDRDDLLAWLWRQPLLHREGEHLLVHAGLFPEWTPDDVEEIADEAHAWLCRRDGLAKVLEAMADERALSWSEELKPKLRAGAAVAALTRLRCLDEEGRRFEAFTGPPSEAPEGLVPWHRHPERRSAFVTVVCGHWAAQGLVNAERLLALDTACVWGGLLTAVRLDDRAVFSVPSAEGRNA